MLSVVALLQCACRATPVAQMVTVAHVDLKRFIYSQTILSRQQRDYVWIIARTPSISEIDHQRLLKIVGEQGYDLNRIQKVPQQWQ
jgi:hypothetical protein